jgi:tetratricopeptide (TPR) repeat protein
MRTAERLMPAQIFGLPDDRERYRLTTLAEYENTVAIAYDALDQRAQALRAARRAIELDSTIPEAHYDIGLLFLRDSLDSAGASEATSHARRAIRHFEEVLTLDETLVDAHSLLGVAAAIAGDCERAVSEFERVSSATAAPRRLYPVESGTGVEFAASIGRRRVITRLPQSLATEAWRSGCRRELDAKRRS